MNTIERILYIVWNINEKNFFNEKNMRLSISLKRKNINLLLN